MSKYNADVTDFVSQRSSNTTGSLLNSVLNTYGTWNCVPVAVHSSSVLGGGSDKNLEDSPLEGSKYVKVYTDKRNVKNICEIDPEYLYEVDGNKVSPLSAERDEAVLYADRIKGYTAYLPKDLYGAL